MKLSTGFKIRILLLIVGICCVVTAISFKRTVTSADLLEHEAQELQENLYAKERVVDAFLSDQRQLEKAKQFHLNPVYARAFINTYRKTNLNLFVYENNRLKFWSTFKVILPKDISAIREGSSFLSFNGKYEVVKKTSGDFTFLFLIGIQNQYPRKNQYLIDEIPKDLSPSGSLTLASIADKEVQNIYNIDNNYLFQVKLVPNYSRNFYTDVELWFWIAGSLLICIFVNFICSRLARNGYPLLATLLIGLFFLVARITDLQYGWLDLQFTMGLFDPRIYAESFFMPSLGDFLLNTFALTWVVIFIYRQKNLYSVPASLQKSKTAAVLLHMLALFVLGVIAMLLDEVFFGLIYNSKINFDITIIINLGWLSWISIFILCLAWLNIYLLTVVFMVYTRKLNFSNRERFFVFIGMLLAFAIFKLLTEFTAFFLVYALFIFIVGYNTYVQQRKFSIGLFAAMFFCLAFNTSIKYIKFNDIKERSRRETLAEKLQNNDEPSTNYSLEALETSIQNDGFILQNFLQPALYKQGILQNYINKMYLDGYLSKYEYHIYQYSADNASFKNDEPVALSRFQRLVQSGSVKIADAHYFYKINDTFGYQHYFGIIPVMHRNEIIGKLVIELRSKNLHKDHQFPELLIDGKISIDNEYKNYSLAFYSNGKLLNQSGQYTYPLINTVFHGEKNKLVFMNDPNPDLDFNHLIFQPSGSRLIIMSKERVPYISRLAALSFFFLVFIVFSTLLYIFIWLIKNLEDERIGWFTINRTLMINANKILYKTRIQASIIISVVITLVIVGWITFYYIRDEYRQQQKELIREKIGKVKQGYERQLAKTGKVETDEQAKAEFNDFADFNNTYLNLFSIDGDLLLTTLPSLYEYGIISKKMGPTAFISLSKEQRSEYVNPEEKIGYFTYAAAYVPIVNEENVTVAYIGLPYYSNEADYNDKISIFITTLINIYALVFVLIGVLAVFLANQITGPLTFIQENISRTKIGQRNEPIVWRRHDEIGSLIREYNNMIAALEESAKKLAKSERESAWREMAKQVAHEIKNPLTPLKLGVQLLEKSWREHDPNFAQKFERFSKSFIEQIESLSRIASEFSNFAKMPDTKLEKIALLPVVSYAKDVFTNSENVDISIANHMDRNVMIFGDKDQLQRVFNNLLKNAIEAVDGDHRGMIRINLKNDETSVFIEVTDNGSGIPEEAHDQIFVPNFTTKSSGTGLGLAFVKQAVENAGGAVGFKSIAGEGTTFYLRFPLS
ncbi:two-component sensor histidine kinase [Pedobacter yulinensis]|uniref:histidine kinase n=1 Tax=Pedobacter yulinensis TaxID=2126353 RepID=A0A2T3HNK1_9SPHI|nr:HAMP domain-containing sensor histidine kinase [Pedobacter yulinensis]PST83987.1 two-component sensor histidine kinase [Pedobacter yulinensis]